MAIDQPVVSTNLLLLVIASPAVALGRLRGPIPLMFASRETITSCGRAKCQCAYYAGLPRGRRLASEKSTSGISRSERPFSLVAHSVSVRGFVARRALVARILPLATQSVKMTKTVAPGCDSPCRGEERILHGFLGRRTKEAAE
jgi:hypothetical protein